MSNLQKYDHLLYKQDFNYIGKIALVDADLMCGGTRHPNLVIMKLAGYFKEKGCDVRLVEDYSELYSGDSTLFDLDCEGKMIDKYEKARQFDAIYISKVFDFTDIDDGLLELSNVFVGGTGFFFDHAPTLPTEIEHHMPDYHIYDQFIDHDVRKNKPTWYKDYLDYSIGFATRGCFRQCDFCVNHNCKRVEFHSHIAEWHDPSRKYIYLWDDKADGQNTCPVYVEIIGEGSDGEFIFKRTVNIHVDTLLQSGKDEFEVREYPIDSDMELHEGKDAETVVDQYMPKKIREYFYFDGERLLNYLTNAESTVSKIRDSIYEIAGVNFINRSGEHLQEYVKQYQKKVADLSPDLVRLSKAMTDANEAVAKKEDEIKKLSQQIAQAEDAIAKADRILDGTEKSREANAKYNANKDNIERDKTDLKKAKEDLVDFVNKYFVKLMMYSINKQTLDYIIEREEKNAINPEVNLNAIEDSLKHHKCRLCTQHIPHDIEEELSKLVIGYKANLSMQTLIGIKGDIRRSLEIGNYQEEKEEIFNRIRELEESIEALENENDALWKDIEIVGDMASVELAARQKTENENLRTLDLDKRGSYKEQLITLKKNAEAATNEYNDAIDQDEKCGKYRDRYKFVSEAYKIVDGVKQGIIDDIKSQMQTETMDIFDRLLWKTDTYDRVELDDNFRLQLYHKRSGQSCLYSCSAAEKELLALSFTIALQNVSGYDNLLFIDTPVGRVSDINRENFAKVLLEVSRDKQIILAFTPSEYSAEIKSVLNDTVISSYNKLSSDEDVTTREGE